MTHAYILVETLPGKSIDLLNAISGKDYIKQCHLVTGPYDIVAFIEAKDLKTLGDILVKEIQATGFVGRTLTCVVVESEET